MCIVWRCDSRIFAVRMPLSSLLHSSLLARHNGARQSDAGRAFCVNHARAAPRLALHYSNFLRSTTLRITASNLSPDVPHPEKVGNTGRYCPHVLSNCFRYRYVVTLEKQRNTPKRRPGGYLAVVGPSAL